jgi:hypothetical protein
MKQKNELRKVSALKDDDGHLFVMQHDWVNIPGAKKWQQCRHCKNIYDTDQEVYVSITGKYFDEEPACITRYPEKNIKEDETDNADRSR